MRWPTVQILNLPQNGESTMSQPLFVTVSGPPAGENMKECIFTQSFSIWSCQPRKKCSLQKISQIITCSRPSLATPSTCLVLWTRWASPAFSQNGMFCWDQEVGDSDELQTFPWSGELPKKATAAKQPNGNHDISLNSEPDLPFFFSFIETFCVPWALGAKKKS